MDLAETISRASYNTSASPDAPENQDRDWRDGYAEGVAPQSADPMQAKWVEIGSPENPPPSWKTWKRGYWAGVFTRLQKRKTMTIRINKATDPGAWYAAHVGKVLPVERVEINRSPSQGIPEDVYWCREGGTYNAINYVRKSDATEV